MSTAANPAATQKPQPSAIQTSPNAVHFDPKATVPSQPLYLQRNDVIRLNIYTNMAACSLLANYRWLTPEGEIKEGSIFSGVFSGTQTLYIEIYEGWLLSIALQQQSSSGPGFWTFVQAQIYRGTIPAPSAIIEGLFWQGFVYYNTWNGWPGNPSKEMTDGTGTLRSITGSVPGAGADISETVPNFRRWTLLNFRAVLTTSAAVASRQVSASLDDGANAFYTIRSSTTQAASLVYSYCMTPGSPFFYDGATGIILPLANLSLFKTGWRIRTNTVSIQGGDQWSAPQYTVLEWPQWDT